MPGPVASRDRIEFLDVLRGVALLGILAVNLPVMALPLAEYDAWSNPFVAPTAENWAGALVRALAENKFMGLFSLLFGMGLALQLDRAVARGVEPRSFYPRRLAWLAVFGVGNGLLLFFGDILLPYAVAGTILYLLRGWSARRMLWLACGLLAIGTGLSVVFEGVLVEDPEADRELLEFLGTLERGLAAGSFLEGTAARGVIYAIWLLQSSLIAFNWRILALFLVGCVVLRAGWAEPAARAVHRRAASVGLVVGLASTAGSTWLHGREDLAVEGRVTDVLLLQVGGLFLTAGYAGAVALWCSSAFLPRVRRWLANTGRMALTNYLGQSFVAGLLLYGHGAGLHGSFTRVEIAGLVLAIFALQVAASTLWLARFPGGPFELLWRRLTYGARRRT